MRMNFHQHVIHAALAGMVGGEGCERHDGISSLQHRPDDRDRRRLQRLLDHLRLLHPIEGEAELEREEIDSLLHVVTVEKFAALIDQAFMRVIGKAICRLPQDRRKPEIYRSLLTSHVGYRGKRGRRNKMLHRHLCHGFGEKDAGS